MKKSQKLKELETCDECLTPNNNHSRECSYYNVNSNNDVIISVGDIRKNLKGCNYRWTYDTISLIIDKLEELENRLNFQLKALQVQTEINRTLIEKLNFIEQNINKDKIVAENGWK